jgi:hypothetical protein
MKIFILNSVKFNCQIIMSIDTTILQAFSLLTIQMRLYANILQCQVTP